ncbi:PilZ domain-containing protein [Lutibaculum baratangense]|uniref:PilZ domain-containing protein n=1 Tax=Lutibaculum baratangense AMV1 TaxID=631454 RepID=V4RII8_9HYPH|nr:PilZ domain-containing protein [Lutibaculum baratangense]ESR25154.1 hypothetical protein N177_2028 [Lutibaculum baratangense AMV1]
MQQAHSAGVLTQSQEKRRFQRVRVDLLGRYMLPSRHEYPCQIIDMSPGGARFVAPAIGDLGERVVAYIDNIGRIEGQITRLFEGGFAISIQATARKRDKLAAQLTWLANKQELGLPEDRRHDRMTPRNPFSEIVMPDGRTYRCKVVDLSLSGAAISCDVKPKMGTVVKLGQMSGRVVRHFEEGFAIQFAAALRDVEALESNFGQLA